MRDIWKELHPWIEQKKRFALATVTKTWGSAPRGVGSTMAISDKMEVIGSVSGGCVEGAVIEAAMEVLESDTPRHLSFGVSDETAWSVGLTCGGKIKVFVEPHLSLATSPPEKAVWKALKSTLEENGTGILITRLSAETYSHAFVSNDDSVEGTPPSDFQQLLPLLKKMFMNRESGEIEWRSEPLFIQSIPARSRLLIVGAAHISIPLVKFARELDFEIVVIDPRKIFATTERFPSPPDQILPLWPEEAFQQLVLNEDTYAVLLTHDPKIDDPALHILLRSPVSYIGALGSQKTHQKRVKRLREAGFSDEEIKRIHAPVGLDIQAKTPEEIAISILGEIVKVRRSPRG